LKKHVSLACMFFYGAASVSISDQVECWFAVQACIVRRYNAGVRWVPVC